MFNHPGAVRGSYLRVHAKDKDDMLNTQKLLDFKWFNITSPLKKEVIKICSQVDDQVSLVNSCNLVINNNGLLQGFNTDIFGIQWSIFKNFSYLNIKNALVFGSGPSAECCVKVLSDLGILTILTGRNQNRCFKIKEQAKTWNTKTDTPRTIPRILDFMPGNSDFINSLLEYVIAPGTLIINTIPWPFFSSVLDSLLGASKKKQLSLKLNILNAGYRKIDKFRQYALLGHIISGGLDWLAAQGAASYLKVSNQGEYKIRGSQKNRDFENKIEETYDYLKNYTTSQEALKKSIILLTGFSGTGKTSLVNDPVIQNKFNALDLDQAVAEHENMTPNEIILTKGREYFRQIEKKILNKLILQFENSLVTEKRKTIISLGGGTLIDRDNQELVKNKCLCFWLLEDPFRSAQRAFESSDKRPFLTDCSSNRINGLWNERKRGYAASCDLVIPMFNKPVQAAAKAIISEIS
jgi:shikimate kinase/shikimate 5-dehydrogenase